MKRSILYAAALALSGATAAHAGDVQRQVLVHYDDINVKQPVGARILLARIDAASAEVCGPAPDIRELGAWYSYKSCTRAATDRAVRSLPFDVMANLDSDMQTIARR